MTPVHSSMTNNSAGLAAESNTNTFKVIKQVWSKNNKQKNCKIKVTDEEIGNGREKKERVRKGKEGKII